MQRLWSFKSARVRDHVPAQPNPHIAAYRAKPWDTHVLVLMKQGPGEHSDQDHGMNSQEPPTNTSQYRFGTAEKSRKYATQILHEIFAHCSTEFVPTGTPPPPPPPQVVSNPKHVVFLPKTLFPTFLGYLGFLYFPAAISVFQHFRRSLQLSPNLLTVSAQRPLDQV